MTIELRCTACREAFTEPSEVWVATTCIVGGLYHQRCIPSDTEAFRVTERLEDNIVPGLRYLGSRSELTDTDTAKPRPGLIIEDVGPTR